MQLQKANNKSEKQTTKETFSTNMEEETNFVCEPFPNWKERQQHAICKKKVPGWAIGESDHDKARLSSAISLSISSKQNA